MTDDSDIQKWEHEKLISQKATYYKNCFVHVKLKENDAWENGTIKEVGSDFLILKLSEEGAVKRKREEMVLFFLEIRDINEYREGFRA